MSLKGKDIISIRDLSKEEIELILKTAEKMEDFARGTKKSRLMEGKILGTLFFEPSTRTRLSFTAAMKRMGGETIGFSGAEGTSVAKGESLTDTIKTVERYCDMIVIRHAREGSARLAADAAKIPVINGGDGGNQHPTQTLLDLYTINKMQRRIKGLNITLLGDLKYARTMRSLALALAMFDANLTFVSPKGLEMSRDIVEEIKTTTKKTFPETNNIEKGFKDADVIYICRIQKERFEDKLEAERIQKKFRITPEILKGCKDNVAILHPLPKIMEIDSRVDEMKCAKYFDQTFYGVPVRMAILSLVQGVI
jgi:aspartate carbamoyltransferase catalytic subunit